MGQMYLGERSVGTATITSRFPKKRKSKKSSQLATKADVRRIIAEDDEWKAIYSHLGSLDVYNSGNGYFALLNGCNNTSPIGLSTRDGREIRNRSVRIWVSHRGNATATSNYPMRFILFIDLEPHGTAPTAAQLLTANGGGWDEAPRNLDSRSRFIILKDKFYQANKYDADGTTVITHQHVFVKHMKLNFKTIFNSGTAATIADIERGALYLFMYHGQGTNTDLAFVSAVVRFTDL